MTGMDFRREMEDKSGHLASAWCIAAVSFILMQGAILMSGPDMCPNPHEGASRARPAFKSDLAEGFSPVSQGSIGQAVGQRYYRCFERPAEKRNGSFVIALACVWPGGESSAGG
ncbi:hypothetical protein BH10PSE7_BH10PSE7_28310 [soil metagenome]